MSSTPEVQLLDRQNLIFDADDTLWENNIYFESAFTQFCEYLAHSRLTPVQVRSILDEIEIANVKIHGYGSRNFARSLEQCLIRLAERDIGQRDVETVRQFAHAILDRPIELIEGVEPTVAELSQRHILTLFTKGDKDEQQIKVDRSGLAQYFKHVVVVMEKNDAAYEKLASERGFALQDTWMIGNSPKSDINPALRVGMNAVFVPHERTWSLEHADVPEIHPRLKRVSKLSELLQIF